MKYKIVNRFRFITFLVVVFLVLSFVLLSFLNISSARSAKNQTYVTIEVMPGDTLWQIARSFGPKGKDVREVIYQICKINSVSAETLKAGQTLLIPIN
ncbi:MAG: LysM peptidoglycan-binding domain-containing protein [Bacillota bacterium]|nr:LysM peptidoglycan-binding domain-containing protein [Bacillota bacterium]